MVAYVVVDFSASGTKPVVRPVGYVKFIDQILNKSKLGEDDIATETCAENGIVGPKIEEPPAAPAQHTWLAYGPPNNLGNSYILFEFTYGIEDKQRLDAAWLCGVIQGRFPNVRTYVMFSPQRAEYV